MLETNNQVKLDDVSTLMIYLIILLLINWTSDH